MEERMGPGVFIETRVPKYESGMNTAAQMYATTGGIKATGLYVMQKLLELYSSNGIMKKSKTRRVHFGGLPRARSINQKGEVMAFPFVTC
jgi:hypothetical protein